MRSKKTMIKTHRKHLNPFPVPAWPSLSTPLLPCYHRRLHPGPSARCQAAHGWAAGVAVSLWQSVSAASSSTHFSPAPGQCSMSCSVDICSATEQLLLILLVLWPWCSFCCFSLFLFPLSLYILPFLCFLKCVFLQVPLAAVPQKGWLAMAGTGWNQLCLAWGKPSSQGPLLTGTTLQLPLPTLGHRHPVQCHIFYL